MIITRGNHGKLTSIMQHLNHTHIFNGTVIDCLQRQNEGRPDTVSVMGMCGKRLHLYMCRYSDKWMQFGLL